MICGKELLDVFAVADRLGTNDKVILYTELIKQNQIVAKIFDYAANPYKRYWMTSIPKVNTDLEHCSWPTLFQALDLLSKGRGADVKDKVIIATIAGSCPHCREIVTRIIKQKLRIGMGVKNLRKSGIDIPLPEAQLCERDPRFFKSKHEFYEAPKYNGVRVLFERVGSDLIFLSRNGHPYLKLHEIFYDIEIPERKQFDGELMSKLGKDHASGVARTVKEFKMPVEELRRLLSIHIWDIPTLSEESLAYRQSYLDEALAWDQPRIERAPHRLVRTQGEREFFKHVWDQTDYWISKGFEGIVIKDPYGEYESGRSNDWVKLKRFHTVDLKVTGIEIGDEGKTAGVVKNLICDFKGVRVDVGSGLDDNQRIEYLTDTPKVIEVKYATITDAGSLESPIFVDRRDDKEGEEDL